MNNLAMLRTRADSRRDLAEETEALRGAAQGRLADLLRQYSDVRAEDVRAEEERITDRRPQIRRLPSWDYSAPTRKSGAEQAAEGVSALGG